MSNLWNPTKQDAAALRRGERKIALHWKIKAKDGKERECSFCGKPVWVLNDGSMFTYSGSSHNCVKKKLHDKLNETH